MIVHSAPSTASVHHDVRGHLSGRPAPTLRPSRLTVEDVMSRDVVTVTPTATFHQMIGLMRKHQVSALPVVGDNGALLGVVSETDLLPKENPPPRRRWLPEGRHSTERRHKASGVSARDVMSTPAISIGGRAVLAAAVRVLEQHGIKRLVVLDGEDHMVGIVSRRDLLAAFCRSDAEIRRDVIEGVIPRWLMIDQAGIRVDVHGGVVRLEGIVDRRSDADILTHLVSGLDGVVHVDSTVNYRWNDRDLAVSRELHVS